MRNKIAKVIRKITGFIIRKFNSMRIKNKLLICYGSLIAFSILTVGSISFIYMKNYVYNQTQQSYKQTLDLVKLNVESSMDTYDELLNQIANDENLIFALYRQYNSSLDYSYQYLTTIKDALKLEMKDKNVMNLHIYKNNSTFPEDGKNVVDISSIKNTWWYSKYFNDFDKFTAKDFIKAKNTKIRYVISESKNGLKSDKAVIIKPIIFNYEILVGILELELKYDAIFGGLDSIVQSSNDNMFITDTEGRWIFGDESGYGKYGVAVQSILKASEDESNAEMTFEDKTNNTLLLASIEDTSKWVYMWEIPLKKLMEGVNVLGSVYFLAALFSLSISILMGIAISLLLSKRIERLSLNMMEVEELTSNEGVVIDGDDEIGNLAKSYNKMLHRLGKMATEIKHSEKIQKEAEMKALQAQINPHFLYNTLATINWMVIRNQKDQIVAMVKNLSTFYRLSLNKGNEYLKIEDEIILTKAYAEIQKIRWADKINLFYLISEDILNYYSPKLILQPFVENSILHGTEHKIDTVTNIIIKGYKENGKVVLEVIDDGMGMKETPMMDAYPASSGYGIKNVYEKIRLKYGSECDLEIFSMIGIGTQIRITLPPILS